jgi:hypothetical protein
MTRAKVSGDCRMTANSAPQANTHKSAITPNVASSFLRTDPRFAVKRSSLV